MADPESEPEPALLLPAALVELLHSLESHSPSLSALPPPADSWGTYFMDGDLEALGESRRQLRLRIMTAIGNCRSLRTINLNPEFERGMYSVRDVEAMALLKGLEHNPALESLSLYWFKGFGTTEACKALSASVVRFSRSLDFLDMRELGLSVEGLGHISAALRDNSSGSVLRVWYLDGNHIGDAVGARHLAGILSHSPALRIVGLFGIGMDDAGAVLIADAVARTSTLRRLDIRYDRLKNPEQAALLIPVLTALSGGASNRSIIHLCLEVTGLSGGQDSAMEAELAKAVATMLSSNTSIEVLTVASFFVRRGLWALPHSSSITKLELLHPDSLNDEELDPLLVSVLHKCTNLQKLHLAFRKPYGPSEFTKEFFQGLRHNPSIKWLVLDGWDGLDDKMFEDLIESLSTNTNLEDILIQDTSWERQGKAQRLVKTSGDTRVEPELLALLADLESESPGLEELPSLGLLRRYFDCYCQDGVCHHRGGWQWEVRLRLLTAIGSCRTLRKIELDPVWLRGCSVRQDEALALLSGLQQNLVLQQLDLCGFNGFVTTAACVQALTAVVAQTSYLSLRVLDLRYAGLSAEVLGDMATALGRNGSSSVLSTLCLCGNNVGNAVGAQHLAHILNNSLALRSLWIVSIGMDEEGAVVIAEALAQTTSLTELRIGDEMVLSTSFHSSELWCGLSPTPHTQLRTSVRILLLRA